MRCPRLVRGLASASVGALLLAADAIGQTTTRVSVSSSGTQSTDVSEDPSVSADGLIVAFMSGADNLVTGDTNRAADVFVHDRTTGVTERVSVGSSGYQGNGASWGSKTSADGRFVLFCSFAFNLVPGDKNTSADVFVHDRSTGTVERVSVDSSGKEGNGPTYYAWLSSDGRFAVFQSFASNLVAGDTNGAADIFVHDRTTGVTERVSVSSSGAEGNGMSYTAAISADGNVVVFDSDASNLVAGDGNQTTDVFVRDRAAGTTERISVDSSGAEADDGSQFPTISDDGSTVAFYGNATNLVAGDTNGTADVFVRDRATSITGRVSVDSSGAEGDGASYAPAISADGLAVVFCSKATNLVAGDTNGEADVFVFDRASGTTERSSVDSSGVQGDDWSGYFPVAISADLSVVAFLSLARNLVAGDTNGVEDVFVHERCPTVASWSNYGNGFPGTFGVPSFTSQQNPGFGTTITLDLANSLLQPTVGLLFVGLQRANLHSGWGGDLLVVPAITQFITFSYGFNSYSGDIPDDQALCGIAIDLQAVEADPGAAEGVSFTPGLELVLGR